jgi:hypothetical protein
MSCADAEGPKARDAIIPPPRNADTRKEGVNERPDPVQYLPLGGDVLLPDADEGEPLPSTVVGPFELRNESLAGALQLILDGTNIPVSFEGQRSLDNVITVTNLKGPINEVVQQVCGLADMYCSYEQGVLNVKDTQIFTVSVPPIGAADQVSTLMTNVAGAIAEITGSTPITDPSTRTIVYRASARTSEMARRYFQRLRSNTALIVFETYIWEVSLNAGNSTGINWSFFDRFGKFNLGISLSGTPNADLGTPVSIGLPTTGAANLATSDVFQFISNYGAVKTISQPQITVLAGSEARLRVADTQNYLASVSRTTTDGGTTTTSTTTDSVDSGFTLVIGSNWDNATVYGNINILLQEVRSIDRFVASDEATIQLPTTSERELQTQVRIRPGDALLIAGLVRERDNLDTNGPGINEPIIPTSRTARTDNVELVFLLRPRVVVFTNGKSQMPTPSAEFPQAGLKAEPLPTLNEPTTLPVPIAPMASPVTEKTAQVSVAPSAPVTAPPPPPVKTTRIAPPPSVAPATDAPASLVPESTSGDDVKSVPQTKADTKNDSAEAVSEDRSAYSEASKNLDDSSAEMMEAQMKSSRPTTRRISQPDADAQEETVSVAPASAPSAPSVRRIKDDTQ